MLRAIAMLSLTLALAACASHAPPDSSAAAHAPAVATTNALAGTPMSAYGTALNRAKNVQAMVDRQTRKQAAAIDAASGSSG